MIVPTYSQKSSDRGIRKQQLFFPFSPSGASGSVSANPSSSSSVISSKKNAKILGSSPGRRSSSFISSVFLDRLLRASINPITRRAHCLTSCWQLVHCCISLAASSSETSVERLSGNNTEMTRSLCACVTCPAMEPSLLI